jgi:hypothetical protein
MSFCWSVTLFAAVLATGVLGLTIVFSKGAAQEAAGAAIACAMVIIAYVFSRRWSS